MSPVNTAPEIRHYILTVLEKMLPVGGSKEFISDSLDSIYLIITESELEIHLQYLVEKGYISYEEVKHRRSGISRKIAKLTAKGIDLMEGNIDPDPGIGLDQE